MGYMPEEGNVAAVLSFVAGAVLGMGLLAVLCGLRRSGEIAQRENDEELGRAVAKRADRWM